MFTKTTNQVFICQEEHLLSYPLRETIKKYYEDSSIISINKITDGQACTCNIGIINSSLDLNKPILISACDNGVYYDREKYNTLLTDENVDVIVWTFRNNPTSRNNPNMYAVLHIVALAD